MESIESNNDIRFDNWGRMLYNPEFHTNQGLPWSKEDLEYLINWYDFIGAEEMSFALGRTITTIQTKANTLRRKGIMNKPSKGIYHKRIKKEMA